ADNTASDGLRRYPWGLFLICGTSLEQIAPESLTLGLSGFVHDYVWVRNKSAAYYLCGVGRLTTIGLARLAGWLFVLLVTCSDPCSRTTPIFPHMVQAIRPHSDRAGRPLVSPSPLIGGAVSGGAIDEQTAAATATDRPVATAFAH